MKTATLLCGLAVALAPQERNAPDFPATPGWHADLASGLYEAKKTGKPLMVVFR